jgi:Rod binding domain-containing protein
MSNPVQSAADRPVMPFEVQARFGRTLDLQDLRQVKDRDEQAFQMARQFEGLLIEEVLKAARSAGDGWLGEDADDTSESTAQMGEQFLAQALAAGGGFGLAARFAPLFKQHLDQAHETAPPDREAKVTNG